MSVQSAVFATSRPVAPTAVLTPRGGEEPTPSGSSRAPAAPGTREVGPLERYLNPTMTYNADAGRLVMMFRDAETGEVIDQIPSESAVRQYEESLRKQERAAREAALKSASGTGGEEVGAGGDGAMAAIGAARDSGVGVGSSLDSADQGGGAAPVDGEAAAGESRDGTRITVGAYFNLVV